MSGSSGTCRNRELVPQAFRVLEAESVVAPLEDGSLGREPPRPEVEGLLRRDAPHHRVNHPRARLSAAHAGVLEERDVAPGRALLVRVEQVVDGRIVLIHRLLDEPEPEHPGVEVHVSRGVRRDARDVVDTVETHLAERIARDERRPRVLASDGGAREAAWSII